MKRLGILLAGGTGSRLYPCTSVVSKQLVPVYDKPTAYYALSTLINLGIKEVLIICKSSDLDQYQKLFLHGTHLGMCIHYAVQDEPKGIADAFNVARSTLNGWIRINTYDQYVLILGDNIFCQSHELECALENENSKEEFVHIFSTEVKDPTQYGVVSYLKNKITIDEKPQQPQSNQAISGIYVFDATVLDKVLSLKPSKRNELEITDLIKLYTRKGAYAHSILENTAWFDTGTPDSLLDAAMYIRSYQNRTGKMIGCIEESAFNKGFITANQLQQYCKILPDNYYRKYLSTLKHPSTLC